MSSWRSRGATKFPPTAWRDAKIKSQVAEIAVLKAQLRDSENAVSELESELDQLSELFRDAKDNADRIGPPSFKAMISYYRTYLHHARSQELYNDEPALQLPRKLRNVALAASHGIRAAEIYAVWNSFDEIDLDVLPDRFVLKADGGAGGHAVFPLARTANGFRRIDEEAELSPVEMQGLLEKLKRRGRGPFFAEELLIGAGPASIADDVKVYMFYGVPTYILLMRPPRTASRSGAGHRFLDPSGEDIGSVLRGVRIDPTIPTPTNLVEIVEAARHLSLAAGTSFCRVDFYDTMQGPRFGEITRAPGTDHHYDYDHDSGMGNEWIRAHARLLRDLGAGRPRGTLWGEHRYDWHYEDAERPSAPSAWPRTHVSCEDWCFPTRS